MWHVTAFFNDKLCTCTLTNPSPLTIVMVTPDLLQLCRIYSVCMFVWQLQTFKITLLDC